MKGHLPVTTIVEGDVPMVLRVIKGWKEIDMDIVTIYMHQEI